MQPIKKTRVRSAVLGLILAATIIEFGRTSIGTFCIVDGESMCPTLNPGDVVQARVSYVKARGDVVIITDDSGSDAVKRIVGLPGEVVTIYGGEVYVNGRRLLEPYLDQGGCTFKNNQKNEPAAVWRLAADEYFVLGDNRYGSGDSRHYGPIRRSEIHGVVDLPENAPGPAFLEIMLSESGELIQNKHYRQTSNRNRTLVARRTSRSKLRSFSEAIVR
jgi:signal peptidase I